MKGVALPIEVLVVVVIAVIVLLGLIAVYFAGWTPFSGTVGVDAVKGAACRFVIYDCSVLLTDVVFDGTMELPVFDANGNGITPEAADNLETLCSNYYDADATQCKRLCGCP
jgi:hypothetical protein